MQPHIETTCKTHLMTCLCHKVNYCTLSLPTANTPLTTPFSTAITNFNEHVMGTVFTVEATAIAGRGCGLFHGLVGELEEVQIVEWDSEDGRQRLSVGNSCSW